MDLSLWRVSLPIVFINAQSVIIFRHMVDRAIVLHRRRLEVNMNICLNHKLCLNIFVFSLFFITAIVEYLVSFASQSPHFLFNAVMLPRKSWSFSHI